MEKTKGLLVNGGYPLHTFEQLQEAYFSYISSSEDRDLIKRAYQFILEKHKDQVRKSGEPYYHHLLEVAYILATLHSGPMTIAAGLLHDVVEDTDTSIKDIEKMFGDEVAKIVDSLTKIQRLKLSKIDKEAFEAEDHRKIFIGMAKDIRVIIVKLADRLHNMRTLSSLSEERQKALSKETLEVFVPIAHRLGLETIKSELADLSIKYLEPEKYQHIVQLLANKEKATKNALGVFSKKIADILFEKDIPFEISFRIKSINSIYDKMYRRNHKFEDIYDLMALRIITDTEIRCYEILGLIHQSYPPIPKRFKDYIAMPKPNMYQSLHTTVISGDGNFYEIQIRTQKMDEIAESGVAAHWAYKEGSGYNSRKEQEEIENKLHWFRDFVSISGQQEDTNASEYMDNLTHDIFDANVYVFTPNGKVIELVSGSTPVDFAYRIHTKVGQSAIGAIVNGNFVPLNTVLNTGDMVEIKTSKNAEPNEGWLDFVKSNLAKSQIKKYLAKKDAELLRDDKISKGKQSCIDAFKDRDVNETKMMEYLSQPSLLEHFEVETVEDLLIGVSAKNPTAGALIDYLGIKKPLVIPNKKTKAVKGDNCPVYCNGADRIAIQLANCCTPIPGDEIIGYITRGSGITVHRKDCPNVQRETDRLIDVYWKEDINKDSYYPVDIMITASERPNLLLDIMNFFANNKINLTAINGSITKQESLLALISATINVRSLEHLQNVFNSVLNIKGVIKITRVIH